MKVDVHDFHTKFHENPCICLRVTEIRRSRTYTIQYNYILL